MIGGTAVVESELPKLPPHEAIKLNNQAPCAKDFLDII
jgi:hypothetical protein